MAKIKRRILATVSRELAQAHHDAYLVELLGQARSGISPERVQQLLAQGVLDASKLGGVVITGMVNVADPFLFMRMVAQAIEKAPPENRVEMRQWSLEQWKTEVDKAIDAERETLPKPEFPDTSSIIDLPGPPEAPRGAVIGATSAPYTADLPDWLDNKSKAAYKQAIERAGEFCRGLGNQLADELHKISMSLSSMYSGMLIHVVNLIRVIGMMSLQSEEDAYRNYVAYYHRLLPEYDNISTQEDAMVYMERLQEFFGWEMSEEDEEYGTE